MAYSLKKERVKALLAELAGSRQVVAPVDEHGVVSYRPIAEGAAVRLEFQNGRTSPKDFFFPQTEKLFHYAYEGGSLRLTEHVPEEPRVIFAMRPCDLAALPLLDNVFAGTFEDSYYLTRRAATTVVGMACQTVADTCFCTSFGVTPGSAGVADAMLYEQDGRYLVEVLTPKGEALVAAAPGYFESAGEQDLAQARRRYTEKPVPAGARVKVEGVARDLDGRFEDPVWDEVATRCLSCGICTYVCPTCHCFLVQDAGTYEDGVRLRCWDSCMYSDYTRMAGGHNPRPNQKERVRQRFLHKLNYYPNRYGGAYLCVGCGRCVDRCPTGLHIPSVLQALRREVAPLG